MSRTIRLTGSTHQKLVDASSSDVRPFIDNIESVSRLYNEPVMLMADEETLCILPADAAKIEDDTNQADLQSIEAL